PSAGGRRHARIFPRRGSEVAPAPRAPAAAAQRAVVLRLPVVARDLLAWLDVAQRPELDAPAAPADVRVGLARVVHVPERVAGDRPVDRRAVLELDDRAPPPAARAAPRPTDRDALAGHLAYLAPRGQPGGGEHAAAVD